MTSLPMFLYLKDWNRVHGNTCEWARPKLVN